MPSTFSCSSLRQARYAAWVQGMGEGEGKGVHVGVKFGVRVRVRVNAPCTLHGGVGESCECESRNGDGRVNEV